MGVQGESGDGSIGSTEFVGEGADGGGLGGIEIGAQIDGRSRCSDCDLVDFLGAIEREHANTQLVGLLDVRGGLVGVAIGAFGDDRLCIHPQGVGDVENQHDFAERRTVEAMAFQDGDCDESRVVVGLHSILPVSLGQGGDHLAQGVLEGVGVAEEQGSFDVVVAAKLLPELRRNEDSSITADGVVVEVVVRHCCEVVGLDRELRSREFSYDVI